MTDIILGSDESIELNVHEQDEAIELNLIDPDSITFDMDVRTVVTSDHNQLLNRDMDDQHPISAIENLQESLDAKQDNLVSGENIKTVGNETLLDSGNVQIMHAAVNGSEQLVLWLA